MTPLRECEQAETQLEDAHGQIQCLTEQKIKHDGELEQLRKQIETLQRARDEGGV